MKTAFDIAYKLRFEESVDEGAIIVKEWAHEILDEVLEIVNTSLTAEIVKFEIKQLKNRIQ